MFLIYVNTIVSNLEIYSSEGELTVVSFWVLCACVSCTLSLSRLMMVQVQANGGT